MLRLTAGYVLFSLLRGSLYPLSVSRSVSVRSVALLNSDSTMGVKPQPLLVNSSLLLAFVLAR